MNLYHEIKGNLARLLATENLVVEHRKDAQTASFDVEKRVLTLPNWELASNTVYDLLVAHEVGHALFTPNIDWSLDHDVPKDYVNVCEDVRIEKLMKRKYGGLPKTFSRGYYELDEKDFFEIADKDLWDFNVIDRINLHFKIGATAMIPFLPEEQVFVMKAEELETFDEVLALAKEIHAYQSKKDEELRQQYQANQPDQMNLPMEGKGDLEKDEKGEIEQPQGQDGDQPTDEMDEGNNQPSPIQTSSQGGGQHNDTDEAKTQKSFDQQTQGLNTKSYNNREITYVELPKKIKTDKIVVDWKEIHEWIDERVSLRNTERLQEEYGLNELNIYEEPDQEYSKFRKQSQKEVNYLVKEFECRKSASAYARAATSRTGVLDTAKLHTYKYNEDLFKKVTVLPDGKNHGLIFVLDWSGSMSSCLLATFKQLLNLTAFCKKVQIPFEVYAFTNEWRIVDRIKAGEQDQYYYSYRDYAQDKDLTPREIFIDDSEFNMMNIISSRSNARDYERQCLNIWREIWPHHRSAWYRPTEGLQLSGTPLNEALVCLHEIIPQFKKTSGAEKVNVTILTDGESSQLGYGRQVQREDREDYTTIGRLHEYCALRDRKTGRVYPQFTDSWVGVTNVLLQQLRHRFTDVNIVGFRVCTGSQLANFVHHYSTSRYEEVQKDWRKFKSTVIPDAIGFTELYAIQQQALDNEVEFNVDSGAKKGEITRAFKKMLGTKSNNKKILSSFVGMVS